MTLLYLTLPGEYLISLDWVAIRHPEVRIPTARIIDIWRLHNVRTVDAALAVESILHNLTRAEAPLLLEYENGSLIVALALNSAGVAHAVIAPLEASDIPQLGQAGARLSSRIRSCYSFASSSVYPREQDQVRLLEL